MPETPQSRYQLGSWTVTRLKDELRSRNLSPMGNKDQLIARLEHDDDHPPGTASPRGRRSTATNGSQYASASLLTTCLLTLPDPCSSVRAV